MTTRKPQIFIGSSNEALPIEKRVREFLDKMGVSTLSWQTAFPPGEFVLTTLFNIHPRIDAALLIVTPDDKTWYRKISTVSPRDNIIFELGFFLSSLGSRRTGIVHYMPRKGGPAKLPSDLYGMTTIRLGQDNWEACELALSNWIESLTPRMRFLHSKIHNQLHKLDDAYSGMAPAMLELIEDLVIDPFYENIRSVRKGMITLTPADYYHRVLTEMENADSSTKVYAVVKAPPQVWTAERDQMKYLAKNIQAALKGCKIQRVYLTGGQLSIELYPAIRDQIQSGILVRQAPMGVLPELKEIPDMVMFIDESRPSIRLYLLEFQQDDSFRIRSAKLVINPETCVGTKRQFDRLWDVSQDIRSTSSIPDEIPARIRPQIPPGIPISHSMLSTSVVTCAEAAEARGIPIQHELKTLILEIDSGVIALHLRGSDKASLNAVKKLLVSNQARLASPDRLKALGLLPGVVCPFIKEVWDLTHIIDESVFDLNFVSTNDSTFTGAITFHPSALLRTEAHAVGIFASRVR